MTRVVIRPTIAADLPFVCSEPQAFRIRSMTVVADEQVVGLGGLGFPPDAVVVAFAQILPGAAKKFPLACHRVGLWMVAEARRCGIKRVLAQAQPGNPAAEPWLLRLGFKPVVGDGGRNTFVWER